MSNFRQKTITVTLPNGTPAGTYQQNFTTDSDCDEIVGIRVIPISGATGGLATYRVGLKPQNGGIPTKDVSNVEDLIATTSVAMNDRWNLVNAPAIAQSYTIVTEIPTPTTSTLTYEFLIRQTISQQ